MPPENLLEDEMSKFERELNSLTPGPPGTTGHFRPHMNGGPHMNSGPPMNGGPHMNGGQLPQRPQQMGPSFPQNHQLPPQQNHQPPQQQHTPMMFRPHVLLRPPAPPRPPSIMAPPGYMMRPSGGPPPPGMLPPPPHFRDAGPPDRPRPYRFDPNNRVIESQPTIYKTPRPPNPVTTIAPVSIAPQIQNPVKPTMPVLSGSVSTNPYTSIAQPVNSAGSIAQYQPGPSNYPDFAGEEAGSSAGPSAAKKAKKPKVPKEKKIIRQVGKDTWEDASLLNWDTNDFRVFCGDLGNEVNDEHLKRAFSQYPSLQQVKVVRDKKTMKSKGYGFLSFSDSDDYIRAMKEMNGKYVGNRPIKLRKSNWKERNMDQVRKKDKFKKKLGLR